MRQSNPILIMLLRGKSSEQDCSSSLPFLSPALLLRLLAEQQEGKVPASAMLSAFAHSDHEEIGGVGCDGQAWDIVHPLQLVSSLQSVSPSSCFNQSHCWVGPTFASVCPVCWTDAAILKGSDEFASYSSSAKLKGGLRNKRIFSSV